MSPQSQTILLAKTGIRSVASGLSHAIREQRLLLLIVVGALAGYMAVGNLLFVRGLGAVHRLPGVGPILTERILFLIFFLFFMMLVFSNSIISYIALFRSRETRWLLTLPISHHALFAWRTIEGVAFSSWGLVVLSAPLLSAYGRLNGLGADFYVKSIGLVVIFIAIPACLASTLLVLFVRFTPTKAWWGIAASGLVALGCVAVWIFKTSRDVVNTGPANAALAFGDAMRHTDISMGKWIPSAWISEAIYGWAGLGLARPLFCTLLIVSTALMAMLVTFQFSGRLFYGAHAASVKRNAARAAGQRGGLGATARAFTGAGSRGGPRFRTGAALARKDGITFRRDAAQWLQFLIIFGLLAVYVLNIRNLGYDYENPKWLAIVVYLNFGVCSLALSTLTTRFVFPQFSLEGQRLWILGMAPVSLPAILIQKFLQAAIATGAITVSLMLVSGVILKLPPGHVAYLAAGMAIMTIGLNAIAIGLGTLLPDFKQTNPAKIVSGFGGTLCLVASFLYILSILVILILPDIEVILSAFAGRFQILVWLTRQTAIIVALLFALCTAGVILGLACRRIKKLNYLRDL